jgi:hypothetical protein
MVVARDSLRLTKVIVSVPKQQSPHRLVEFGSCLPWQAPMFGRLNACICSACKRCRDKLDVFSILRKESPEATLTTHNGCCVTCHTVATVPLTQPSQSPRAPSFCVVAVTAVSAFHRVVFSTGCVLSLTSPHAQSPTGNVKQRVKWLRRPWIASKE